MHLAPQSTRWNDRKGTCSRVPLVTRAHISLLLLTLLLPPAALTQSQPAYTPPTSAQIRLAATPASDPTWRKHAVIYATYPRSLQNPHRAGTRDLKGIN